MEEVSTQASAGGTDIAIGFDTVDILRGREAPDLLSADRRSGLLSMISGGQYDLALASFPIHGVHPHRPQRAS